MVKQGIDSIPPKGNKTWPITDLFCLILTTSSASFYFIRILDISIFTWVSLITGITYFFVRPTRSSRVFIVLAVFLLYEFIFMLFTSELKNAQSIVIKNFVNSLILVYLYSLFKNLSGFDYRRLMFYSTIPFLFGFIFFMSTVAREFTFYGLTVPITVKLYNVFGVTLESVNDRVIFRNTLAEFWLIMGLIVGGWRSKILYFQSILYFSRRSFLVILVSFLKLRYLPMLIPALPLIGVFQKTRLFETEDSARLNMYRSAIGDISNYLIGNGLGAKTDGSYVHNFFLSHYYMGGIIGLCFAVMLIISLGLNLARGKKKSSLTLLVFLLSVMVGSNTEGLFSVGILFLLATRLT